MPEIKALRRVTEAIEHASVLDAAVDFDRKVVTAFARPRAVRQLLHGVPFGHPIHPLMVQVPLGAWISAAVLDLIGGKGGVEKPYSQSRLQRRNQLHKTSKMQISF